MKIEICMWNVWNLKIWELKCLNWDVWILEVENWKFKFEISMWSIWNLKNWKLKIEISLWNVWIKFENLKFEMSENWKLKCLNIENGNV